MNSNDDDDDEQYDATNSSSLSKLGSKSPDISSSVAKTAPKPTKTTAAYLQPSTKNATTIINNESRDLPDITQVSSKPTASIGCDASSTVDTTKTTDNKSSTAITPISSNMGIVYSPQKSTQGTSTNAATVSANDKG